MSNVSRPTSHWSSSRLLAGSNNRVTPLLIARKKLSQLSRNNRPPFAEHMAKTKHEVEELFKLYCSNDTKFNTFQQTVTGTRISTPHAPSLIQTYVTDAFQSKHCVSREDFTQFDIHDDEYQTAINELHKIPIKRGNQVRNDDSSISIQLTSLLPPLAVESIHSNSNLTGSKKKFSLPRQDELPSVKPIAFRRNMSNNSVEHNNTKKSKSTNSQRPISSKSSLTTLSSVLATTFSSINNQKDPINVSHSSLSTTNSLQEHNQSNIVTGTAIIAQKRSATKSARHKQRPKSYKTASENLYPQRPDIKTSSFSTESDESEYPINIVTQPVASIPSKCSRYVLITFPQAAVRYNTPTYVERLLLPERFPVLFQNILHSSQHNLNDT